MPPENFVTLCEIYLKTERDDNKGRDRKNGEASRSGFGNDDGGAYRT